LTSEEVEAIRKVSSPVLKSIIDMLYLTGQRIGDILKIKLSDMTEDGIYVKQIKTKNELIIGWSPELKQAVSEAKALNPVRGLYLYHRGGHKLSYVSVRKLWDKARIEAYMSEHALPVHPLVEQGYPSIGCSPCTTKVAPGEDPRSGRWKGWDKVECGIHTAVTPLDDSANDPIF
jgi:hypothetical protein